MRALGLDRCAGDCEDKKRQIADRHPVHSLTDDSFAFAFAFELLEKAGVGVAPGVDFGQMG